MERYGYRKVLIKSERTVVRIMSVLILFLLLCFGTINVSALESPYHIQTAEDLAEFAKIVNSGDNCSGVDVILDSDIDLSSYTSWIPIGNKSSRSFNGNFDGMNHTISNLTITDYSSDYCGLFGCVKGGSIKNLTITNISVSSTKSYVGGLAGYVDSSGSLINCSICSGIVSSCGHPDKSIINIGGIIGCFSGTMEYCCSAVNVSGNGNCGGNVGGLVGEVKANSVSRIRNCYFAGCSVICSSTDVGGIVGLAGLDSSVILQNCYSAGVVSGKKDTNSFIGRTRGVLSVSGGFELVRDKPYVKHFSDKTDTAAIFGDDVWNNFTPFEECGFSSSVWKIDSSLAAYKLPIFVWQSSDLLESLDASYLHTVHTEVIDSAVPATCTSSGLSSGSHCSVCDTILIPQTVIPALGHSEVLDSAVPATCTSSGLTTGSHCSVCSAILTSQSVIPALGHSEVSDSAVPATCTSSGLSSGSHCSVCSAILTPQSVVPALGHSEVIDSAVPATCTSSGLTTGSHCSLCDTILIPQTVTPALGHSEVIDSAVLPTYYSSGLTEGLHCSRCGESIITQQMIPPLEYHSSSSRGSSVLLPPVLESEVIITTEPVLVEQSYLMPNTFESAASKKQAVSSFIPFAGFISGLCAAYFRYRKRL